MEEKRKVPKIRFKGFTDDWEQRKFEDYGSVSMCKRIFKNETSENGDVPFYKIGTFGEEADAFISNEKYEYYKSKFSFPNKGDILLSASGTIGRIVEYTGEKAYFQDSNIIWFNHNAKIKNSFLKVLYPTVKWDGIEGSTIKRLYNSNFLNTEISVPELKEQDQIGLFFNNLDNLITLHQRKYEKLVNMKKSMLEKMFPKNSSKIPEIRFKGFTDDWEQRKLDKYLEQYTEVTKINNQYPALTSSRKGIFFQTEYFAGNQIASDNNIGYNIVPRNYFTYRHMSDDEIFHFNINDICDFGIVSTLYPVFTTKNNMDSKYLQYQLNCGKEFYNYSILQKQGGSRTYMYFAKLKELYLTIPSYNEQCKISSFLTEIDNLITLHQRKLEKLNNMKKSMLEKMFV